ncbi:MAG: streptomycin 6-kinase [Actinomycetota bacterium]|nr:streptomycin 6-kinase [Actinomycetota bacterium]
MAANVRGVPALEQWAADLPSTVRALADRWHLQVGEPFEPGGECSWVAPVVRSGEQLVLKVGWWHAEAEHEAEALRFWDGDGAVRLVDATASAGTLALLLERCQPGAPLKDLPEPEQDTIVAGLLRGLWRTPPPGSVFRPLAQMCDEWAAKARSSYEDREADRGLVSEGVALFRQLPLDDVEPMLLCTDLHAQNVLSAEREPWLVIDPKPYVGDPAYDVTQHMLNCPERLAADPVGLAVRMADLTGLDARRVIQWLFGRCIQEGGLNARAYGIARRLTASI